MLAAIALAGCGSSGAARPAPTSTVAAVHATSTDPTFPGKTATAVESLASTAVAVLAARAAIHRGSSAPPIGRGPAKHSVAVLAASLTPVPTARARSQPTASAVPPTVGVKRPVFQLAALVSCCTATQITNSHELRSPLFTAIGAWSLRWVIRCSGAMRGARPLLTVGVIPSGTNRPVDVFQTSVPSTRAVQGIRQETLGGTYYLDVISPCRAWLIEAVTKVASRRPAAAQAQTQETAVAVARADHSFVLLAAARAQVAGPAGATARATAGTLPHPTPSATSVSTIAVRVGRVASLRAFLAQLRLRYDALKGAARSVDPAGPDYNPQSLNAVTATLNSTAGQLRSLTPNLVTQPVAAPFGRPVRRLEAAARRLREATTELDTSIVDLRAGHSDAAASDLSKANAALHRADNALKRAQVLLQAICASAC